MAKRELTTKQKRFIELYDGNGVKAAREAGYKGSDNTLAQVAAENLRKPHLNKLIQARERTKLKEKIASREERQAFWTDVMKAKEKSSITVGKGEEKKVLEIKPKMSDRLKASEHLGKSEGDFIERHEVELKAIVLQAPDVEKGGGKAAGEAHGD